MISILALLIAYDSDECRMFFSGKYQYSGKNLRKLQTVDYLNKQLR